ncbi:GNAT family N-acetyltransferase [Flocculibacter collagenilyticus]|uniref:GNAT family N-acetyltransferase n=1 Tax=Flocculibacter collagenilyticus TaxID=2744479 RepID=UPI0018F77004|nr:GNAT family N-acetyltransferase [Flocculibacter collagenilyticus]
MDVVKVSKSNYQELIEIWEASVRATHDFLPEENISELKPLILQQYFDAVELSAVKRSGEIQGFIGVADSNIEMLFVKPEYFGIGIGRKLIKYALNNLGAFKVDVNEQNPNAIRFYEKMDFKQVGRSALDGQGNPFPLIHMMYNGSQTG